MNVNAERNHLRRRTYSIYNKNQRDAAWQHVETVDAIDLGGLVGYLTPSVSNINVHTLHLPNLLLEFSYNN